MNRFIRGVIIPGVATLVSIGCLAQGRKTITYPDGSKDVFEISTGWTQTDKDGKTKNMSPASLAYVCSNLGTAIEMHMDIGGMRVACDEWAQLQPRTKIESVSFSTLMNRLVVISPPATDFSRYRGTQLRSQANAALYDATIVPNDVGEHTTCTILQDLEPARGDAFYKYACSIKTASYPDAIALEKNLVERLGGLGLIEDQITEHGFAIKDKDNNECAPTGECAHSHMFSSAIKDNKIVEIEAQPDFVRNAELDIQMMMLSGHHNVVDRVAPDSGTVEFSVYSHGSAQSR